MDSSHEAQIENLRRTIAGLGNQLENLSREKETIYQEKKIIEQQLSDAISAAKELKVSKASIDGQIKEKKHLRTKFNTELKTTSVKFAELRKTSRAVKGES